MTKALLYKGDNLNRANMAWNIAGSFVYAFASMVLSFLVIRLAGEEQGGIFSFGFSTLGQQLFLVAYFGIRPYQIQYLQQELAWLTAESGYRCADLDLQQAIQNYNWAVAGVAVSVE